MGRNTRTQLKTTNSKSTTVVSTMQTSSLTYADFSTRSSASESTDSTTFIQKETTNPLLDTRTTVTTGKTTNFLKQLIFFILRPYFVVFIHFFSFTFVNYYCLLCCFSCLFACWRCGLFCSKIEKSKERFKRNEVNGCWSKRRCWSKSRQSTIRRQFVCSFGMKNKKKLQKRHFGFKKKLSMI